MQLGIIGTGRIGRMHARTLARHAQVEHLLIHGRSHERMEAAVEYVQRCTTDDTSIAGCADIDHLLATVDGVVIASSTDSHPELVRRAVAAKVPVLVEKPLAIEASVLADLAMELDEQQIPVMVGFQRRYDPAYQRLRSHVLRGDLGPIRVARSCGHDRHQLHLPYVEGSGGIWRDLLVHDFDVVPWVLGDHVVRVHATGAVLDEPRYREYGDVDTAVAVLTMSSGAIVTVSGARHLGAGHDVRLEVFGTADSYGVGFDDHMPVTSVDDQGTAPARVHEDFDARFAPAFRAEIDHFIRLIQGRATNLTPPIAGLDALRIAEAAEESYWTGNVVDLPAPQ